MSCEELLCAVTNDAFCDVACPFRGKKINKAAIFAIEIVHWRGNSSSMAVAKNTGGGNIDDVGCHHRRVYSFSHGCIYIYRAGRRGSTREK